MANRSKLTESEQAAAVERWESAASDDQRRALADELGVAVSTILRWRTTMKRAVTTATRPADEPKADPSPALRRSQPLHWTPDDTDAFHAWIKQSDAGDDPLTLDGMILITQVKNALIHQDKPAEAAITAAFARGCEIGEDLKQLPNGLSIAERARIVAGYIQAALPKSFWTTSLNERAPIGVKKRQVATASDKARIRALVRDCPADVILEYRRAVAAHKEMLKENGPDSASETVELAAAKAQFLSA